MVDLEREAAQITLAMETLASQERQALAAADAKKSVANTIGGTILFAAAVGLVLGLLVIFHG